MNSQSINVASAYWNERKDAIYLYAARQVCVKYAQEAKSVIDVGSNGTPTLEWYRGGADKLVSLDLKRPYKADGVESITTDLLLYEPENKFDLVTCFQVLEHVPDARRFAEKLMKIGDMVIVSVPYNWRKGWCQYHVHDPVDEKKMLDWFGKKPIFGYIAHELNNVKRLIQVYGA